MNCSELHNILDDYLDNLLDDANAAAVALHIQSCPECASELQNRESLRSELRALPAATPRPGFLEQAVANAAAAAEQSRTAPDGRGLSRRGGLFAIVPAIAAALVAAILVTSVMRTPDNVPPETTLQGIHLATDTVTPVKLAFSAETALEDARLSLSLPVGVELMGYDGRTDLSWTTDLEEGTNVLRLPLIGRMAASDVLVARLEHASGAKTFRLPVTVSE